MDLLTIIPGVAALYYLNKNSKESQLELDKKAAELKNLIDQQRIYLDAKIEDRTTRYNPMEKLKCTSVAVDLKSLIDKYWNGSFSATFHNSDTIDLKIQTIRLQVYVAGVGFQNFTSGSDSVYIIKANSDYKIQLSGKNSCKFVEQKSDRDRIRSAFSQAKRKTDKWDWKKDSGAVVDVTGVIGYVILASAVHSKNEQSDDKVLGKCRYIGAGTFGGTQKNYGGW